jgi:hypothetical protein
MHHIAQALQLHTLNNSEGICRMMVAVAKVLPDNHVPERRVPSASFCLEETLDLYSPGKEFSLE